MGVGRQVWRAASNDIALLELVHNLYRSQTIHIKTDDASRKALIHWGVKRYVRHFIEPLFDLGAEAIPQIE